jgi:DNA polymerase-4
MPSIRARRLCPEGVFIAPDFSKYTAVSREIRSIFEGHTPLVEPLSLDEAYLDVTGVPNATETAKTIRQQIRTETQLTASAGVAPNKFLAKIASDWKKPDGLFVIRPEQIETFLVGLPIRKIPGVGKATEKVMTELGVATVGDLQRFSAEQLVDRFGKWGTRLWELARGIDESPVEPSRQRKSWSSESTFPRDITLDEVADYIRKEAHTLWEALGERKLVGRTVTVKLRTGRFETATRRMTPEVPPASGDDLARIGTELLKRFDFPAEAKFRLAGIGVSNFMEGEEKEPALFSYNAPP